MPPTMAKAPSLPETLSFFNPKPASSSIKLAPSKVRFPQCPSSAVTSLSCSLSKLSLRSCRISNSSKVVMCRSTYNVQVIVGENENEERLVNRFRRDVLRAGIIQESKRRKFFENSQEKRKRKTREAAKRNRKRRPVVRAGPMSAEEEEKKKKKKDGWYDETDDSWELPPNIP